MVEFSSWCTSSTSIGRLRSPTGQLRGFVPESGVVGHSVQADEKRSAKPSAAVEHPSITKDIRLRPRIIVEEHVAVLTDIGVASERVAAIAGLLCVFLVHAVAAELGRNPLIL